MNKDWSRGDKILAWTLAVTVIAVIVTVTVPDIRVRMGLESKSRFVVAGTVVDAKTNHGLGGTEISVVGRAEHCRSEDSGNFRMQVDQSASDNSEPIRLRANRDGYQPLDVSVSLPSTSVILALRKSTQ